MDTADDWDPFWFQLLLDSTDDPFYWSSDYGPGTVTVSDGERKLEIRMSMQNAASMSIFVDARVVLP